MAMVVSMNTKCIFFPSLDVTMKNIRSLTGGSSEIQVIHLDDDCSHPVSSAQWDDPNVE